MFAVIESGGKQFKVAKNDVIEVEKLSVEVGAKVDLGRVLLLGGDGATVVGTPAVEGASVTAQVLDQTRGEKIIVFKKKRRKNYRRKQGHRQDLTVLRITEISPGGTKTAKAKPAAETKAETKQPETKQPETEKKAPAKKSAAKPKAAAKGETETKAKPKAKKAEEPKKTEEPKKAEEPKKTEEKD